MTDTTLIPNKKIKNPEVRRTQNGFVCLNDINNENLNEWFSSKATHNYLIEFSSFYNKALENFVQEKNGELWAFKDIALDFVFWSCPELRRHNSELLANSKKKLNEQNSTEKAYEKLKWTILENARYYGIDLRGKFYEDIEAEADELIESLNESFNRILSEIKRWDSLKEEWTSVRALNYSHYFFSSGQLRAIGRIATAIHYFKKIKFNAKSKPNLYRKDILLTIMEFSDSTQIINSIKLDRLIECYLTLQLNEPNTIEQLELKRIKTV